MKPVVWITGAGGLIGNHLVQTAPQSAPQFQIVALTQPILDLTDRAAVRTEFARQRPAIIIHCAAMSRSPECQAQPQLARRVNVEAAAHLAELAAEIPFVFFSTDLVFDGRKGNYVETDAVNPLSIYAETKVAAESMVCRLPHHLIIRSALNGGISPTGDRGFNEQLRLAWQRGQAANLFTDEFRSPIPAVVTARAVWELVQCAAAGTFHLAGAARLSRLEIGRLLAARHPELRPQIIAGSLKDYSGAPRPADVSLDCGKVQRLLSFPLPALSDWLAVNPNELF